MNLIKAEFSKEGGSYNQHFSHSFKYGKQATKNHQVIFNLYIYKHQYLQEFLDLINMLTSFVVHNLFVDLLLCVKLLLRIL